jgi:hypothetical protein
VRIPSEAAFGEHRIVAIGTAAAGGTLELSTPITVLVAPPATDGLPVPSPLLLLLLALGGVSLGLALATHRRAWRP